MERLSIHLLSDSIGELAEQVARAALSQFEPGLFRIERLPRVRSVEQLRTLVSRHCGSSCIFFYTFADETLRDEMVRISDAAAANSVDILGPAMSLLGKVAASEPSGEAGAYRRIDADYYARFAALDFAMKHDDGQRPESLPEADIVLLGVSRTGKTPLAMYLAFKGYKTANVPLVPGVEPPNEVYLLDRHRLFGLTTDPIVLLHVREKRVREMGARRSKYVDIVEIEREIEESRALMRRLGCIMIRTDNRAIEESASEILRHLEPPVEEGILESEEGPSG
jgi:regulator of PEP synthase PpsR (kinase-PPPase family)